MDEEALIEKVNDYSLYLTDEYLVDVCKAFLGFDDLTAFLQRPHFFSFLSGDIYNCIWLENYTKK